MQKLRLFRTISLALLMSLISEILSPVLLFALTGGPMQIDFQGSPGSSEMVDLFTGEFKYNLPLLTVPGPNGSSYPIELSYQSNFSPDDDASWVGFGWSLNPGAVLRNKKGFADDWQNSAVTYYNRVEPTVTWTAGLYADAEVFDVKGISLGTTTYFGYNNYNGFISGAGFFSSIMGIGSLNLNVDESGGSFSASVSPIGILQNYAMSGEGRTDLLKVLPAGLAGPSLGTTWNFSQPTSKPTSSFHFEGSATSFSGGYQKTEKTLKGYSFGLMGSLSRIEPWGLEDDKGVETIPCYGYMYSAKAQARPSVLMDYFVEKEKPFLTKDNKFLSIPFSAPDDFVATGQGARGKFRLHQSNAGLFRPNYQTSAIQILNIGATAIFPDVEPKTSPPIAPEEGTSDEGTPDEGTENKEADPSAVFGAGGTIANGTSSFTVGGYTGGSYAFTDWNAGNWFQVNDVDLGRLNTVKQTGEPYYFRFDNDRGGSKLYFDGDDNATRAWGSSRVYDSRLLPPIMNYGARHQRNTYIGYRTIKEIDESTTYGVPYRAYNKASTARGWVKREGTSETFLSSIGEIAIAGTNGSRYVYGLPVYARNEYHLNFSVDDPSKIQNNFSVNDETALITDKSRHVIGECQAQPYASMFLLTEMTTSDYYDVNNNGPDPQDIGGYTKFNYQRKYGGDDKETSASSGWYRWRAPYKGFRYSRNLLSDPRDDKASVSYGEKEVYYLESIETKTHIAVFVTNETNKDIGGIHFQGSGKKRLDAFCANPNEGQAASGTSTYPASPTTNNMQYLEEIHLYAKDENGNLTKLLKKIRLGYDYSLMAGGSALNSAPDTDLVPGSSTSERPGKLTLRYIWSESEGVVNARTSPYEFIYQYPTYPDKYSNFTISTFLDREQNPNYNPANIDRWGKYQLDGLLRYGAGQDWLDQKEQTSFDPAAWHLKRIKLPTGGEIHVQYEQHEYEYVQNRPAMTMVPLLEKSTDNSVAGPVQSKMFLDLTTAFGSTVSLDEKELLKARINKWFKDNPLDREKIYFKSLYHLYSSEVGGCNIEYIKGYARVYGCGLDGSNDLYVNLGNGETNEVPRKDQPIQAAYDFRKAYDHSMVEDEDCSIQHPFNYGEEDVAAGVTNLYNAGGSYLVPTSEPAFLESAISNSSTLRSYLRIPVFRPKKGGGVRVKKLLFFNPESSSGAGDQTLYGSEYIYQTYETSQDGNEEHRISSGVAANEPGIGREENALVRLIGENDPDIIDNVVAGEKVVQHEGPLGESILPAPSIGYSRVIVRNIFPGEPNPGFMVYDYHTVKDFPTLKPDITGVDAVPNTSKPLLGLLQYSNEEMSASQGYSFIRNHMHGVLKGAYNYGGNYDPTASTRSEAFDNGVLVGSTQYTYYEPGAEVPVMYAPDRPLRMRSIGKETEVIMEHRAATEVIENLPVNYSIGVMLEFPYGMGSFFPYMYYKRDAIYLHVTTKIVDLPVLLKNVNTYHEGATTSVTNDAFDAVTGSPVITHTSDGYNNLDLEKDDGHDGSYYSYSIPAHMIYENMGQRSNGERTIIHNIKEPDNWTLPNIRINVHSAQSKADPGRGVTVAGYCSFTFEEPYTAYTEQDVLIARYRLKELIKTLSPGDLIELSHASAGTRITRLKPAGLFYLGRMTKNNINEGTYNPSVEFELFDPEFGSAPGGVEAPLKGNGLSDTPVNFFEVVRSGRDNNLGQSAGSITVYGAKDEVNAAIQYAKDLRTREHYALRFNHWIYGGFRSNSESTLEISSLLTNHTLTWEHMFPTVDAAKNFDLVNNYGIPFNPNMGAITMACDEPHDWLYCKPFDSDATPLTKYSLIFSKKEISSHSNMLYLGWWNNLANEWVKPTNSDAPELCMQEFVYTGTETFGINDDGHLVYNSSPYDNKSSLPNPTFSNRNVNFDFRGINGPTTATVGVDLTRINALPTTNATSLLNKVLQANAQIFDQQWISIDASAEPVNNYEIGRLGVWRPLTGYIYKTDEIVDGAYDASPGEQRTYTGAGTFTLPKLFDYVSTTSTANPGWQQLGVIEKYTPTGIPIQTHNVLGITSATVYSHRNIVPAFSAYNATTGQIAFESFEDKTNAYVGIAHTGKQSRMISSTTNNYETTTATMRSPMIARFWVRNGTVDNDVDMQATSSPGAGVLGVSVLVGGSSVSSSYFSIDRIARTGEWVLYQVSVQTPALGGSAVGNMGLKFTAHSSNVYYVDDIRLQPLNAVGASYVYERNTLRPLAVLDDNHFALIYQYDMEGKPIRTIKETIKGYKTLAEGTGNFPRKTDLADLEQPGHILTTDVGGLTTGGSPYQPPVSGIKRRKTSGSTSNPKGTGGKVDMLDINITPDKTKLRVFGQDSLGLPTEKILPSVKNPLNSKRSVDTIPSIRQFSPLDSLSSDALRQHATDSVKKRMDSSTRKINK